MAKCGAHSDKGKKQIGHQESNGVDREEIWVERAPLHWELADTEPAARGIIGLLSDWFPATTGEIVHVDGGLHSTGQ